VRPIEVMRRGASGPLYQTISFVGSGAFTHVGSAATGGYLFSGLLNAAGGAAALVPGDVIIVNLANAAVADIGGAQLTVVGIDTGTPWSLMHSDLYANGTTADANQQVQWLEYDGADTGITIPATGNSARSIAGTVLALRGIDLNMDVPPVTATGLNTARPDCPAITPVTPGAWVGIFGAGASATGAALTQPSGTAATANHFQQAVATSQTQDAMAAFALKEDWAGGAYDPAAFGGGSAVAGDSWAGVTIAFKPKPGP
jgi:hypothetical protein